MNDILFIRENPKFIISFLKNTLEIIKDNNSKNNKSYDYKNIKSVYLKKELNISPYITHNFLALLIISLRKKKDKTLIIETVSSKDAIYLKNCDMKKVNDFITKINSRISENKNKLEF